MNSVIQPLWNAIRLPIVGIMLMLEPVVQFICGWGLVLGLFVSILFEISAAGPRFPFLQCVGISLGFGVILFLYYAVLSMLIAD